MCWRCGVAVPSRSRTGSHFCSLIRDDVDYEYCSTCYEGAYRYGELLEDLDTWTETSQVGIIGTWDKRSEVHDLEQVEDRIYTGYIAIGHSLLEQFQIVVDGNKQDIMYPAQNKANSSIRIIGPNADGKGKHWLIDGRTDKALAGSVYQITFEWGERVRRIKWEKMNERPSDLQFLQQHSCYIVASWNRWEVQEMQSLPGDEEAYEVTFEIDDSTRAKFHFLRDREASQGIYPASDSAEDPGIPIRGPDDCGIGKNFVIRGDPKEVVTLRLSLNNGHITLTGVSDSDAKWSWESAEECSLMYNVTGSFNDWGLSPMIPDGERPGVFRYRFQHEPALEAVKFQIVVDGERGLTLHPTTPDAELGEGLLSGPDAEGEGLHWIIREELFDVYDIVLNWNHRDRRKMVCCELANCLVKLEAAGASAIPHPEDMRQSITSATEVVEYRVLQQGLVKRLGTEPDATIMRLQRPVGHTIFTTGQTWRGPRGGEWVELDSITEASGWMLVEGPGFSAPGPLLQRIPQPEYEPPMLLHVERPMEAKSSLADRDDREEGALIEYREFLLRPSASVREAKEWIALIFGLEPQRIIIAQPKTQDSGPWSYMQSRVLYDDENMANAGYKDGDEVKYIFTGDLGKAYEGKEPTWAGKQLGNSQAQQSKQTLPGKATSDASRFPELAEHFQVLGLPASTPHDAIKHKYRRLALECHPDKHPEDVEVAKQKFQQLKDSYQRLRERLNF
jgi:hypothetical protein